MDLDGTLVRADGTIGEHDRACIAGLRARGVHVSIVTGRAPLSTLSVARELELETRCVCVDGAALLDPRSGALATLSRVPQHAVDVGLGVFAQLGLAPFITDVNGFHGAIECAQLGAAVSGWTPRVSLKPRTALASAARGPVLLLLGIGRPAAARRAERELSGRLGPEIACGAFPLGGEELWAVRIQAVECTKRAGLVALAAELGVERENVAYVGDWYNDVSAFEWAGSSFCMGHAPAAVKTHASAVLAATSARGGGIAEAVEFWLSGVPSAESGCESVTTRPAQEDA